MTAIGLLFYSKEHGNIFWKMALPQVRLLLLDVHEFLSLIVLIVQFSGHFLLRLCFILTCVICVS